MPDDAFAITKPNAAAVLRLADSSEIDIGENTKLQVGAFNSVQSGNQNTIVLNGGALHFSIRHPQGGQSNYKFVTATSQIAVRGTEGFLIAGVNGTQVVCVSCAAGDVSVQVGQQTISVVTNQTLTVLGSNPLTATTSIASNPTINNPAVNQFNANQNPFSPTASGQGLDPTGSFSGVGTGAAAGTSGVVTGVVAGAAAGTAAVVAASNSKSSPAPESPTPAPTPQPTSTPLLPGVLVLQVNFPGATTFPSSVFPWPFSQLQATGTATFSCQPASVITCTAQQAIQGTTLNGVLSAQFSGPGAFTVGGTASGYTLPATTFTVYSAVTLTSPAAPISFTQVPSSQTIILNQQPAGANLTATVNCPGGATAANVTLSGASGPSPLHVTVTANAAPTTNPPPAVACTISVAGQGDGPAASLSIPVNVTSTGIGVSNRRRKL